MTNAHGLFKGQNERGSGVRQKKTFGECLSAAWKAAKSYIGQCISIVWMWGAPSVKVQQSASYVAGVAAEYARGGYLAD